MEIQQHDQTLSIRGIRELSAANAHSVRQLVCAAVVPGLHAIEVDLSETTFVDGSGLGALVAVYKAASECSGNGPPAFRLLHPQPPVQQVFELTRMHHIFEIVLQNGQEHVNGVQQPHTSLQSEHTR
jgi:anti-sigma B factor antagonist